MESKFLNLGLEIIGLGVFNFDFGAINKESPVIKACAWLVCLMRSPSKALLAQPLCGLCFC